MQSDRESCPENRSEKVMRILPRESFRKPTRIFPENLAAVFIAANTVLGPQIFDRNSSRFPGRVVTRKIRGGFRIMFGASMLHDVLILVLQIVEAIQKIKISWVLRETISSIKNRTGARHVECQHAQNVESIKPKK